MIAKITGQIMCATGRALATMRGLWDFLFPDR
jgi:hypothetical protein